MRSKRSRALLGAMTLLCLCTLTITLLLPQLIKHRVHQRLQAHPELSYHGLRVSPTWRIHLDALTLEHRDTTLACTHISAQPMLRAPHLQHLHIERCHAQLHNTPSTREDTPPPTTDNHTSALDLTPHTDALHAALTRAKRIDIQRIDLGGTYGNHTLNAHAQDLHFERSTTHDRLQTTLHLHRPIDAQALRVHIDWSNDRTAVQIRNDAPITIAHNDQHWRLDFQTIALNDGREFTLPELRVFEGTNTTPTARLQDLRLSYNGAPHLHIHGGELHLPPWHIDRLFKPPAPHQPAPHVDAPLPPKDPTTTRDDLWSLRTLERTRHWARALHKVSAFDGGKLPLNLVAENLEIRRDNTHWMTLKHAEIQQDKPLSLRVKIGDADLAVHADATTDPTWHITLQNAPLDRLAEGVELDAYLSGTSDASIEITPRPNTLEIDGTWTLKNAVLNHPKVSPEPIGPLNTDGDVHAVFASEAHTPSHIHSDLVVNGLPLRFELNAAPKNQRTRFRGHLRLAQPMACDEIWAAIPRGLTPDLPHDAVRFNGTMQPELSLQYDAGNFDSFTLKSRGVPGGCTLQITEDLFAPERLNHADYIHHVQEGVTADDIYVGPGTEDYVSIDTLPPYVPALMYLSEEIDFYTNHAISIGLINRGIRHSLPRKRFAYGGSTVTQQLVKNLFFSRTKILTRKFQEAIVAWAMTDHVSKDRILELYLNCIEFGPNLYGIVAASRHYFNKAPSDLSALEAAWLASLKPSPKRGARSFKRGHSDYNNWNSRRLETLLWRVVEYTDFLQPEDVEAFAPYVVYFPHSPNAGARPQALRNDTTPPRDAAADPATTPPKSSDHRIENKDTQ